MVIDVSYSDIIRWWRLQRFDVLKHISWINNYPKENTGGFYILQTVKNPKQPCPFLLKEKEATCLIHTIKPRACADAPLSYKDKEKIAFCPGFEEIDPKIGEDIRKEQYKDFRLAFDCRGFLLALLTQARHGN